MAEIAAPPCVCDNLQAMAPPEDPALFEALMALKPAGLSPNAWAVRAGVNRNVFGDVKKRGKLHHETLEKLLDAAGITWAQWDAIRSRPREEAREQARSDALNDPFQVFRHDRPRDVRVLGVPSCGDYDADGRNVETIEMDLDEVVDYVRRPATLDGRRDVYAIYTQGFSMVPRFEPGEVAYVDGQKAPAIGDYVVVQLKAARGHEEERIVSALLKRLVRQSSEWVELEQFNPEMVFRVQRQRIARMHRIFPLAELVGV